MVAILLAAAALRLGALPQLPVGLHYDEAANVILTRQIADGSYTPLFIRAYTGKEVLFFYLAAPWVRITDGAPWGLRLGAAMLGLLTVAVTAPATRALLGPGRDTRRIALFAAAGMAVAFPHILLSRYGFRAIAQPLLQGLTVALLWRGWRSGRRGWLIAGGLSLGLTGYTYLAARLFPLPLGLALLWLLWRTPPSERRQRVAQLVWAGGAALLAFAPLGAYFLRHPEAFLTRIDQVAAPTAAAAWRGIWLCIKGLFWPGAGEFYVRFNTPGQPFLGLILTALGIWGAAALCRRRGNAVDSAARLFLLTAIPVMLLPSALATAEITPSNLRLVGLYPFVMLLPALGLDALLRRLPRPRPELALAVWLIGGGVYTGATYARWAASAALFYAADGEMVLAAQALDATDLRETTVYIASEHYRHPTVAALAENYAEAKWLTGGAIFVVPPSGAAQFARYLLPATLSPPAPWPADLTQGWVLDGTLRDPAGEPALWQYWLYPATYAEPWRDPPAANFAHVVHLHAARTLQPCVAGAPCPILIVWEPRANYPALQPVVRLHSPATGEWARVTAFHYPPAEWMPGERVWDQYVVTPPFGMPPGEQYEIGVRFFNPDTGEVLPLLVDETFAGLEARFPLGPLATAPNPPPAEVVAAACGTASQPQAIGAAGLQLLGWSALPTSWRPGEAHPLTLCWLAPADPLPEQPVRLLLTGPEARTLYAGAPAAGATPFSQWQPRQLVEDRYSVRLPRDLAPGAYTLLVQVGEHAPVTLGTLEVQPLARTFAAPAPEVSLAADFGEAIRLLGYDLATEGGQLALTVYWQALAEMETRYTVFVHLVDENGQILAQRDSAPRGGNYPTSLWMTGEIISETYTLPLPEGQYRVRLGFYEPETGARLHYEGADGLTLPDAPGE